MTLAIHDVRLVPAGVSGLATGLIGWVSCRYGSLLLDGIALRRAASGRPVLSYPARRDRRDRDHPYLRPVDEEARQEIERAVLQALGFEEALA